MVDAPTKTRALPAPAPFVFPETEPFWSAAKTGRLVLPFCKCCNHPIWYPKAFCSACGAADLEWRQVSGEGVIYSFTEVHRGEGPYREVGSYILALVDLDEGARVLTNIVDVEPADLSIGQRVRVVFHDASETAALPRFVPAPQKS